MVLELGKNRSRRPRRLFGKLSIRRKVAFALLLSFVFTLPTAILSLLYLSTLFVGINTITEHDVKLGQQVSELKIIMLDIQRDERNYIMFGNDKEQKVIEDKIERAKTIIGEIRTIVPVDDLDAVNVMLNHLVVYSNTFNILVEHITNNPPQEETLKKIRAAFSEKFSDFQSVYRRILKDLERASSAERDSILAKANEYLDGFSIDLLLNNAASSDHSVLTSSIRENLENSRQSFLTAADVLGDKSWSYMEAHKESNLRLNARARRNIIVVLILTLIMCFLIVTYFPRYIVKPITSLNQTFRKAEAGDFDAQAHIRSKDEIADLAVSYNRMMSHLKHYDELKTAKITTQKRSIDRLLENLDVPVCILTENLRATYYNTLFVNLFGSSIPSKAPELGLEITKIPEMEDLVKELKATINQARNMFVYHHTCRDGSVQDVKGQLVRDHIMNLVSIILVGVTEKNAGGGS